MVDAIQKPFTKILLVKIFARKTFLEVAILQFCGFVIDQI